MALFLTALFVYYQAATRIPRNSDNASIVLEGQDLLAGNWNLSGWTLPPDTFWTTDIPIYALAAKMFGIGPFLMDAVPALIFALTVATCVWLAARPYRGRVALLAGLVAFTLAGIPSAQTQTPVALYVLMGPIHMGTILFGVLALAMLEKALPSCVASRPISLQRAPYMIVGLLLATAAAVGDPFAIVIFLLPMALVGVILRARDGDRRVALLTLVWALVPLMLAQGILHLVRLTGGFDAHHLDARFVSFSGVAQSLTVATQGLLCIFGADFFDRPVFHRDTILLLVHAGALCFVLIGIARTFPPRGKDDTTQTWASQIAAVAFIVTFAAYALSTNASSLTMTRYLLPLPFFGAIIGGRTFAIWFTEHRRHRVLLVTAAMVVAVSAVTSFGLLFGRSPSTVPESELGSWLENHRLYNGFASFWDASIVTVASQGTVAVRPVIAQNGYLARFDWHSKRAWYESETASGELPMRTEGGHPAVFFVWRDIPRDGYPPYGVDLQTAINTFGPPDTMDEVGPFRVAGWGHDLLPELRVP